MGAPGQRDCRPSLTLSLVTGSHRAVSRAAHGPTRDRAMGPRRPREVVGPMCLRSEAWSAEGEAPGQWDYCPSLTLSLATGGHRALGRAAPGPTRDRAMGPRRPHEVVGPMCLRSEAWAAEEGAPSQEALGRAASSHWRREVTELVAPPRTEAPCAEQLLANKLAEP